MKKKLTKVFGVVIITAIMMTPIAAQAALKNFTFDMTHQLTIGTYTSTKESVTGTINMTSWGGDNYFTIHVYEKKGGSSVLITRLGYEKSSTGSPYVDTDTAVVKGHTYTYELWKNYNGLRIKGSGTLDY
ncbi:hypothetical protein [Rossellomorea aquimaris]|jgi:hypothetical protein|uniref:hypothetical protein n=1 Tax=Rossellomorea aquimaris TaxID=189382 RepID=UPI0024954D60|nr:hypothetical protein [Rossellomorea aquimaris]